jgi:hypothetical protein
MAPQAQEFDDLAEFIAYRDSENYVEPETDIIPFENYARQNVESVSKKIIRPKFTAPILARSKCAQKLCAARNALPPHIQAQVEALCVSAAKETLLLAQTNASPPPPLTRMMRNCTPMRAMNLACPYVWISMSQFGLQKDVNF